MKSRRIAIACGGSGGHLAPGIALAEELSARGYQPVLFVSPKAIDRQMLARYPSWPVVSLPVLPPSRKFLKFLKFCWGQCVALVRALRFLRRHPAGAVVVTGGFTSPPLALAGFLRRTPLFIHESNRIPGRVTRHLARVARRIYLPPETEVKGRWRRRVKACGYPLRSEFLKPPPAPEGVGTQRAEKGLTLLLLGGSQGAWALNRWFCQHLDALKPSFGRLRCVTGQSYYEAHRADLERRQQEDPAVHFYPFGDDMPSLLREADLVIARAGAGTIAECMHCALPMVLIPLPSAADDHQQANAEWARESGCACVVRQAELDALLPLVQWLAAAPGFLHYMRSKIRDLGESDARRQIADDLLGSLAEPERS